MQSKAATVAQYLASLPEDRRAAVTAVREVILKNLDPTYEEGMQYGMIGYYVPHSVFPAGYHCDPRQPLPYASLASQKNHMALYLMCIYGSTSEEKWFREAWKRTGRKLDMGKSCVRFKKVEDLALDVIGEAFRRTPARMYLENYQATLGRSAKPKSQGKPAGKVKPSTKAKAKSAPRARPAAKAKKPAKRAQVGTRKGAATRRRA